MVKQKEKNHALAQAKAQLSSIKEYIRRLNAADDSYRNTGSESERESVEREIQEDALSVRVRSGWVSAPQNMKAEEFEILLCTGGPAVRIVGNLSKYSEPESARIEYQDWFTPWTEYRMDAEEEKTVLEYCRQFYFGE